MVGCDNVTNRAKITRDISREGAINVDSVTGLVSIDRFCEEIWSTSTGGISDIHWRSHRRRNAARQVGDGSRGTRAACSPLLKKRDVHAGAGSLRRFEGIMAGDGAVVAAETTWEGRRPWSLGVDDKKQK